MNTDVRNSVENKKCSGGFMTLQECSWVAPQCWELQALGKPYMAPISHGGFDHVISSVLYQSWNHELPP